MVTLTGRRCRGAGQGFTLIELLLAVVLVVLLVGAMVFSFSTLRRGAELEEGAAQLEGLLRFARAHAANTGRQVQVSFEEDVADGVTMALGNIRVVWEADPLGAPGAFTDLLAAADLVERITNLVQIQTARLLESDGSVLPATLSLNAPGALPDEEEPVEYLPPITFYPDGSSDSAEIRLASREEDDERRIVVRLLGITGAIRRQFVVEEAENAEPEGQKNLKPETNRVADTSVSLEAPKSP